MVVAGDCARGRVRGTFSVRRPPDSPLRQEGHQTRVHLCSMERIYYYCGRTTGILMCVFGRPRRTFCLVVFVFHSCLEYPDTGTPPPPPFLSGTDRSPSQVRDMTCSTQAPPWSRRRRPAPSTPRPQFFLRHSCRFNGCVMPQSLRLSDSFAAALLPPLLQILNQGSPYMTTPSTTPLASLLSAGCSRRQNEVNQNNVRLLLASEPALLIQQ